MANETTDTKKAAHTAKQAVKHAEAAEERMIRHEKRIDRKLRNLREMTSLDKAEDVASKQFNGFVDFIREQSVVGLAIGLVIGTQIKQLVDSLVANFFNPLIGLVLPGKGSLEEKTFTLHFWGKEGEFGYGAFIMTLLSLIIVSALVYIAYKGLKLDKLTKKKDEAKKDDKKSDKKDAKK